MNIEDMTVDYFGEVLKTPGLENRVRPEPYLNKEGVKGCKAGFFLNGSWYQYSVSRTESKVYPGEVAAAIASATRQITRQEITREGKQFDATVFVDGHAYMLAFSVQTSDSDA
jgi:hypothetical protein